MKKTIQATSKYSLGNCAELALQALDHVLNTLHADMNAEIYLIHGGDHVFLVMNRDPRSNPQDPATWGDAAVICDPWADKVYRASDYLSQLKNFYSFRGQNYTENFDANEHVLLPFGDFNTTYLHNAKTVANLKAEFIQKLKSVFEMLIVYRSGLDAELKRLKEKYGESDQRIPILSDKITQIDSLISESSQTIDAFIRKKYAESYQSVKEELSQEFESICNNIVYRLQFTPQEKEVLFEHKGQDKKTDAMRFFGMKSKTRANIEGLSEPLHEKLKKG